MSQHSCCDARSWPCWHVRTRARPVVRAEARSHINMFLRETGDDLRLSSACEAAVSLPVRVCLSVRACVCVGV